MVAPSQVMKEHFVRDAFGLCPLWMIAAPFIAIRRVSTLPGVLRDLDTHARARIHSLKAKKFAPWNSRS
jgi:hypothetical protein